MRKPILAVWLLLLPAAWAFHEGPGQDAMRLDDVDDQLATAEEGVAAEDWDAAIKAYEAALDDLPAERVHASRRIRLALAQAQLNNQQLPKARSGVAKLVQDMTADPDADPVLLAEAQRVHASTQYYWTWLMRLEGLDREEWEPEIEASRQTYRLLAERATARGEDATELLEDLESAVLLARMELEELEGLPLPSQ